MHKSVLLGLLVVQGSAPRDEPTTAFIDVSVVSAEVGNVSTGQTVLVQGDHISWVGATDQAVIPVGAVRIEGRGRFLVPGLADMHAHVDPDAMGVFLAYGVTTVRELNGDTARLTLAREIAAGAKDGPTLIIGGPLLAGERQRWRHVLLETAQQAREEVAREASMGYRSVKVYDGLSLDVYLAIVRSAKEHDLWVTGHIPRLVGLDTALAQGQNIEHVASIIDAVARQTADSAALENALDRVKRAGVWVTPTLAAFEALFLTSDPAVWKRFDAPELGLVDPGTREWWRSLRRGDSALGLSPRAVARWQTYERVVRGLAHRDVPMLAGSDTPNPLMVPGLSLHEELRALEAAGVERRAVLAMATSRPAEFMGTGGEFGVIRVGARADLLLVERNPFEDLSVLRSPVGVMARGRWYSRARLEEMLDQVMRQYR